MLRKTFVATCSAAVFLFTGSAAMVQAKPSVERLPVDFASLTTEQAEWATDRFEAHHQRVQALEEAGELTRDTFDAIFDEFIVDLDRLLAEGRSSDKSISSCNQACKLADTGKNDICSAAGLAATALAACPTSVYAIDADYYADIECQTSTLFTVPYACMGPSGQSQALGWLSSSKTRALKAWNNAWYSYSTDGCSQNYQTAIEASNAYVNFHNARTAMTNCN